MSFSVRVHPAPFSPTPDRHAGIGLKMKGGGPGGSRFELVGLLDPQRKEHKRCRSPKRGRRPSAPTPPGVGVGSGVAVVWGRMGMWRSLKERSDDLSQEPPFHPHPPYFFLLCFLASFSFHFFLCALDQLPHPSSVSLIGSASSLIRPLFR